jgi:ubiquinone/menaquinone biosynthesis C-methylase UbiE
MGLVSRQRGDQGHRDLQSPDEWTRKVATYFSDSSAYWDDVYSSHTVKAQVYRNRMAVVGQWATMVGPGSVAAEVGTGAGHFAVFLAQGGVRVAAIDASEVMLARAAQNALRAGVADLVTPINCDAQRLEVASATCDLVVAIGLLSWVKHPELALAEMVRITKPGGRVIVTMDNSLSLARWLDPGWHVSVRGLIHRIRRLIAGNPVEDLPVQLPAPMTRSEFNRLLDTAGLEQLKFEAIGFGPFTFLGRTVLPNTIGLRVDRLLQRLADDNVPWLKRAAIFHVALAVKPTAQ